MLFAVREVKVEEGAELDCVPFASLLEGKVDGGSVVACWRGGWLCDGVSCEQSECEEGGV